MIIGQSDDSTPIIQSKHIEIRYTQLEGGKPDVWLLCGMPFRAWLTVVAAIMSGFLFGYEVGIMSGALVKLSADTAADNGNWGVAGSNIKKEIIVTMTIAMAAVGALLSGVLNNMLGRKPVLVLGATIITMAAFIMALAGNWVFLVFGRAVAGVAVGLLSMTAPVYISEQMSTEWRGPINICNQLMITIGIVTACVVAGLFSNTPEGWRWMLGLIGLPSMVMLLVLYHVPESCRWLAGQHREDEGKAVLISLRGTTEITAEWDDIIEERTASAEKSSSSGLGHLQDMYQDISVRRALVLGVLLQLFQQLTGINSIIYYSTSIVIMAGITDISSAIWIAALVGVVNFTFTFVGLYLVERVGRKPLMIGSLFGMLVGLTIISVVFHLIDDKGMTSLGWVTCLGLAVYCAGFAPGMGPLPWAINSEIFPSWCRNTALAITTATNWVCNSVVAISFLSVAAEVGTAQTFGIYLLITIIAIIYFTFFLPETRDVPLEKVQHLFRQQLIFTPCS